MSSTLTGGWQDKFETKTQSGMAWRATLSSIGPVSKRDVEFVSSLSFEEWDIAQR